MIDFYQHEAQIKDWLSNELRNRAEDYTVPDENNLTGRAIEISHLAIVCVYELFSTTDAPEIVGILAAEAATKFEQENDW